MGLSILGFGITGLVALIMFLIGLLLVAKRISFFGTGETLRGLFSGIPGGPKLWGVIFIVIGLAGGGLAYGWTATTDLFGGNMDFTASTFNQEQKVLPGAMLDCKFSTISTSSAVSNSTTLTQDSSNNRRYTVYVQNYTSVGDESINGTLSCDSNRENIREGAVADCYIEGDSFKSFTSTTDSNTYEILATTTTVSDVAGKSWQQTAYLQDNAVATTSSDQEVTKLVFAQDEANQALGFYFTLPGDTVLNYLRADTDPQDVRIICDGETQATITIVKQKAV